VEGVSLNVQEANLTAKQRMEELTQSDADIQQTQARLQVVVESS
jgi:hypothetical protein